MQPILQIWMINQTRRHNNPPAFTLIELVVVIFIISLSAALIMPRLWDTGERAVKSEAKRVGNTMRYIFDEASGKKKDYLFTVNLDTDSWGYESENESRTFTMRNDVMFKDIIVPSLGEMSTGEFVLKFGPAGPEEPLILHLVKAEIEYTVSFNHISGRVKVLEGHKQWEQDTGSGVQGSGVGG